MNRDPINAIVEAEKGSLKRALFDEHRAILRYRQVNAIYPFAYGFILNTTSEDGDEIDCYLLTEKHLDVGDVVNCIPIGLLEVFENEEVDNKVICLVDDDDFKFDLKHIGLIKGFILQIFQKHPDIEIKFGGLRDKDYTINFINKSMK